MKPKTPAKVIDLSLDDLDLTLDGAPLDLRYADLLTLDEDDLLALDDVVSAVLYDLLPPRQAQIDFCRMLASASEEDPLTLDDPFGGFRFWWGKYQRDGNLKALEMAYLGGHAALRAYDKPAGLGYKYAISPEFPGVYMPTEILQCDDPCWKLLIRLPHADNPRVRSNVKGGAHPNFRVVWFNTDTDFPVDRSEPFQLVRRSGGI